MLYEELSYKIIGCCIAVHKALGPGLLEQCYHNALFYELKDAGFKVGYNTPFIVHYKGRVVGEYYADLVVEDRVILELKAVRDISKAHIAQLLNYLHISGCRVGYLANFQKSTFNFKRLAV